jgi:hypothetical protein
MDHRDSGPPWTGLRRRPEELTGALPTSAPVHESSPRPLRKNEELVRVRSRASPEVEEQRGGWATAVKIWRVVLAFYRGAGLLGVEMPVGNGR